MAKSDIEKALERHQKNLKTAADKQAREQKRAEEKRALQEKAASIVQGQPIIGNFKIMDSASEEMLKVICSQYTENESNYVSGNTDIFPAPYQYSLKLQFEKLSIYGMIVSYGVYMGGNWEAHLSPQAFSYFDDKEKTLESQSVSVVNKKNFKEYDLFLSHANDDKLAYVDGLYDCLKKLGIRIFYDKEELEWGDNWKQRILDGTAKSEFAIIVISNNFFGREWTERELSEFMQRQNESGQKIILPLLYNITLDELKEKYPYLTDIQCLKTKDKTVEEVVILFAGQLLKRYKSL